MTFSRRHRPESLNASYGDREDNLYGNLVGTYRESDLSKLSIMQDALNLAFLPLSALIMAGECRTEAKALTPALKDAILAANAAICRVLQYDQGFEEEGSELVPI